MCIRVRALLQHSAFTILIVNGSPTVNLERFGRAYRLAGVLFTAFGHLAAQVWAAYRGPRHESTKCRKPQSFDRKRSPMVPSCYEIIPYKSKFESNSLSEILSLKGLLMLGASYKAMRSW